MTYKKKCLVTGGMGFIGSHVTDQLLERGHQVWVIDDLSTGNEENANPAASYEIHSICDLAFTNALINKVKPDWIFHLAALPRIQPSFEDPVSHDEANVRATLNLLLTIKDIPIDAFVFSSSSSVYGNPSELPTTELAAINPLSPYALQKYTAERYLHILAERYNLPVVSLRYFNPYGPRSFNNKNPFNAYTSVVGIFKNQKKEGKVLTITGAGQQRRDFIHVLDVASANIIAAEKILTAKWNVYNVGSGYSISILDLAKMFDSPYEFIPERKGEAEITLSNSDKLKALGWATTIEVQDAIRRNIV